MGILKYLILKLGYIKILITNFAIGHVVIIQTGYVD